MLCRKETVCFTGHRELKTDKNCLFMQVYTTVETLIEEGYRNFCTGGARGFDALAAEVVLQLQEKYPYIHLILILPFYNQYIHEKGWSDAEVAQYHHLKCKASRIVYVQQSYHSGCYYQRDRMLVNLSSVCICYQYKNTGGTAYTTRYARKRGLSVLQCSALR